MNSPLPRAWLLWASLVAAVLLLLAPRPGAAHPKAGEIRLGDHLAVPHRLIVRLATPSLLEQEVSRAAAAGTRSRVEVQSLAARRTVAALQAEQAAFLATVAQSLPQARLGAYRDGQGVLRPLTTQIVLNTVVLELPEAPTSGEIKGLLALPEVQGVYRDRRYAPRLFASAVMVGAPVAWDRLGDRARAGQGIRIGSMDGGLHRLAPMFRGDGFLYPADYPQGGLGLTANNNGKIVVSRAYFRPWDPPLSGDADPWPGEYSTSHGVHTASIAAGNLVTDATYLGLSLPAMSGMAPGAWVGSYRLFYASRLNDGTFHTAEGLAALEDIARDGMDVLNNSWGSGPGSVGAPFDLLDQALVNLAVSGTVVVMAGGNDGPYAATIDHPADAYITVAATGVPAGQGGQELVAPFSSRGPSTRGTLKPDLAAPGVGITAQGFAPGRVGQDRHLGYGRASGTSMAAPHVAGAAALLRSLHPSWTPADVKSVLMSTAQIRQIFVEGGEPAGPLDMGAGRLDIAAALDPGLLLHPPQVDFGLVVSRTTTAPATVVRTLRVTSVATGSQEIYTLRAVESPGSRWPPPDLPGVSVFPDRLFLSPGESAMVTVALDPGRVGLGVHQGYLLFSGLDHEHHLPIFVNQVAPPAPADLLLINADTTEALGAPGYAAYYTRTLEALGTSYTYVDAPSLVGSGLPYVPEFPDLMAYATVLIFTGDNYYPGNGFGTPTPLGGADMANLNAYVQAGGTLLIMGQDATNVMQGSFFLNRTLGAISLQDSVSQQSVPPLPVQGRLSGPQALRTILLDLRAPQGGLGVQAMSVPDGVPLVSASSVFTVDNFTRSLDYAVHIQAGVPVTVTGARVHTETGGVSGPVLHALWPFEGPVVVTETLAWSGRLFLEPWQAELRQEGGLRVTVDGEGFAQGVATGVVPDTQVMGDGAGNQRYVDELSVHAYGDGRPDPSADPWEVAQYVPLLAYPASPLLEEGVVAMAHRDQPALERPGIAFRGRTVFAAFGLEGVNNATGFTGRELLLQRLLNYLQDEPRASLTVLPPVDSTAMVRIQVAMTSTVPDAALTAVRVDWGDGSPIVSGPAPALQHSYDLCGPYTVRVEVTDSYGNRGLHEEKLQVTACRRRLPPRLFLPHLMR